VTAKGISTQKPWQLFSPSPSIEKVYKRSLLFHLHSRSRSKVTHLKKSVHSHALIRNRGLLNISRTSPTHSRGHPDIRSWRECSKSMSSRRREIRPARPPCLLRPGRRLICACCIPQGTTMVWRTERTLSTWVRQNDDLGQREAKERDAGGFFQHSRYGFIWFSENLSWAYH